MQQIRWIFWAGLAALMGPGSVWASAGQAADPQLRAALIKAVGESSSFQDRFMAEVWLTDMSHRLRRRIKEPQQRIEFLKRVHQEAARVKLPPELVLAVIDVESNFDRFAISRVGARGLMQIMPFWLEEIGRPGDNLFHVQTNLRFGCTILRLYLDRERGNMHRALARYNGSTGKNWYPRRVMRAYRNRWFAQ